MTTTKISITENGPLVLAEGRVELLGERGERVPVPEGTTVALCRCGRSQNKPFCDGSHARTGWRSAERLG
ncbi:CDGSH iron-sulfur domain-containing protein [Thermoleophilia bacterium SCSIO 60948]|nr:CDGSH iron-sulfur domain-containing protein [Thermoleophilia bacterium SCSIO 60948]